MRPHSLEKCISNSPIYDRTNTQRHDIHRPILIQIIELKHLLTGINRTAPVSEPLGIGAMKHLAMHGIRCQISNGILNRRQMVQRLQHIVDIKTHDAAEDRRNGEQDRRHIDGEANVREQRAEHYSHGLATADYAETVERADEEHRDSALQVVCKGS